MKPHQHSNHTLRFARMLREAGWGRGEWASDDAPSAASWAWYAVAAALLVLLVL